MLARGLATVRSVPDSGGKRADSNTFEWQSADLLSPVLGRLCSGAPRFNLPSGALPLDPPFCRAIAPISGRAGTKNPPPPSIPRPSRLRADPVLRKL